METSVVNECPESLRCQLVIDYGSFANTKIPSKSQVYLSQADGLQSNDEFHVFETKEKISYVSIVNDFGPLNLSSIARFIQILDQEMASAASRKLVYKIEAGRRSLTNAICLLGAYLAVRLDRNLIQVSKCFSWLKEDDVEGYRDASHLAPKFLLMPNDCWAALQRAKELDWFNIPAAGKPALWGLTNLENYDHYARPFNGDLHVVVPGKLVAFRAPKGLGSLKVLNNYLRGSRELSPAYYADVFRAMRVSAVVQLNDTLYDTQPFADAGIAHHTLPLDDGTAPAPALIARFLSIVDAAPGLVAVHCHAGLGRTGTLAALYMMRTCGFGARSAIAWLRMARPGSVLGEQQRFLCAVEAGMAALAGSSAPAAEVGRALRRAGGGSVAAPTPRCAAAAHDTLSLGAVRRLRYRNRPSMCRAEPASLRPQPAAVSPLGGRSTGIGDGDSGGKPPSDRSPAHAATSPGLTMLGRRPRSAPRAAGHGRGSDGDGAVEPGVRRRGVAAAPPLRFSGSGAGSRPQSSG